MNGFVNRFFSHLFGEKTAIRANGLPNALAGEFVLEEALLTSSFANWFVSKCRPVLMIELRFVSIVFFNFFPHATFRTFRHWTCGPFDTLTSEFVLEEAIIASSLTNRPVDTRTGPNVEVLTFIGAFFLWS